MMHKNFLAALFVSVLSLSASVVFAKPKSKFNLYRNVSDICYQVKTSLSENAPKASYGTGFVVNAKRGWLITNYHVVSDVIQKKNSTYRNFVVIDGKPIQAKILDIDILRDLALIQIDYQFKSEIKLQSKAIKEGEKIFSFGIPKDLKLSMVDGIFNGYLENGPFHKILMSTPINGGMSGGPVTNNEGKLVGVNVSTLRNSDNISFSVPGKFVGELISHVEEGGARISDLDYGKNQLYLQSQILMGQNDIFLAMQKNWKKEVLNEWSVPMFGDLMKCWMQKLNEHIKTESEKVIAFGKFCEVPDSMFLSSDEKFEGTLFYTMNIFSASNKKLNRFQFADFLNGLFNSPKMLRNENYNNDEEEAPSTLHQCSNLKMKNKKNLTFQVSYCTSTYLKYPKIMETFFKMITYDDSGNNALIVNFILDGFTSDNAIEFLKKVVEDISFQKFNKDS
ncbi:MAG: serine protease [Bacteriovoracaceae bacterium]|nr:serine protease [Bacteriovoracaceae bacterium]